LDEQKALKILLVAGGRMFFLEEKQTCSQFLISWDQDLHATSKCFRSSCAPDPGAHLYSKFCRVDRRSFFAEWKQNPFFI